MIDSGSNQETLLRVDFALPDKHPCKCDAGIQRKIYAGVQSVR